MAVKARLKAKGFTLIELLVASVILFSAIAVATVIFKSSYVASEKAQQRMEQAGVVPALLSQIQAEIRDKTTENSVELDGKGDIWGISYQWQAQMIAFKSPPDKFDNSSGNMESHDKRYKLWLVDLTLGTGTGSLVYQYHELSWLKL